MKHFLSRSRKTLALSAILCTGIAANAQVATTYSFTQSAGTYTAATGGTVLANATNANMDEDEFSVTIPAFTFDGNTYTSIFVNTNGYITFGEAAGTYEYTPLSNTLTYAGAISAFGTDVDMASSGTRNIRVVQVGNEFVIQWQNVCRYSVTGERLSFQIRLNTVTNEIKIVYGGTITPGADTDYPEIGLRGADNTFGTNVNNREILQATGAWTNSVAGTSNASTCYFNSATAGTVPAVGTTYTWTPLPDLEISSLLFTTTNSCYSNNETVSVTVKNLGGSTVNFATTPLTINAAATGANPQTFTPVTVNTGTLAPGATQTIQVATGYDMSTSGSTYAFNASLTCSADVRVSNNSRTASTQNLRPSANYADISICEGSDGELTGTATALPYTMSTTNSTPVSIPDDNLTGVTSSIVVSNAGSATASSVTVTINSLTHTYTGDLTLTLIAPDGSSVDLAVYASEDPYADFINTVFTSSATTPIASGVNPFTGNFLPEEAFSGLTGAANGTWQLHVVDDAGFDTGTLNSWSISFSSNNSITAYAWSPATDLSSATDATPTANPAATANYTLTVTDERGCTATDAVAVNVNALPTVTASSDATDDAVCAGADVTLTGGGTATDFSWDNSVVDGVAFEPATTTTYTVTGTDANDCSATATITITVNEGPTVTATSDATGDEICAGGSVALTAGGTATDYSWDNGVEDGEAFEPATTTTYTVTGTDGTDCATTATITVTVNEVPTVTASSDATDDAICIGGSVTLTGGGTATGYTWDNSVVNAEAFDPTTTTTYTVTGTDDNNCSAIATITITVNNLPTVTASSDATDDAICAGSEVTLTGGGTATDFSWDNSVVDDEAFEPTTTTTYTVTGTDANNCSATATITITVNPLPNVSVSLPVSEVCVYDDAITLSGGTPAGGTFTGTGVSAGNFDPEVAGLGTSTITYTFTDANGCTATATDNILVDDCLGLDEAASAALTVAPNPSTGLFMVTVSNQQELNGIEVIDAQGKAVAFTTTQQNASSFVIDLSNVNSGIYFLRGTLNNAPVFLRLNKQ